MRLCKILVLVFAVCASFAAWGQESKPIRRGIEFRVVDCKRAERIKVMVERSGGLDSLKDKRQLMLGVSAYAQVRSEWKVDDRQLVRAVLTHARKTSNDRYKPYVTYLLLSWGGMSVTDKADPIKWAGSVTVKAPSAVSCSAIYGFKLNPSDDENSRDVNLVPSTQQVFSWNATMETDDKPTRKRERGIVIVRIESEQSKVTGTVKIGKVGFKFTTALEGEYDAKDEKGGITDLPDEKPKEVVETKTDG